FGGGAGRSARRGGPPPARPREGGGGAAAPRAPAGRAGPRDGGVRTPPFLRRRGRGARVGRGLPRGVGGPTVRRGGLRGPRLRPRLDRRGLLRRGRAA